MQGLASTMLIGHLPAGYLSATPLLDRLGVPERQRRMLLGAALAGSVVPDLDLLYFYTLGGDVHHHALVPHWPLFWIVLTAVGLAAASLWKSRFLALGASFAGGAALLHLALDSIAGAVRWGAPFSTIETTLVEVPARHGWWVLSMATHWTFAVEVALTMTAFIVWKLRRRRTLAAP